MRFYLSLRGIDIVPECLWFWWNISWFSNFKIFHRFPIFGGGRSLVRFIIGAVSSVFIIVLESRNRPIIVNFSGRTTFILFIGLITAYAEYLFIFLLDLSNFVLICNAACILILGVCRGNIIKMRKSLTSQGNLLSWLIVGLGVGWIVAFCVAAGHFVVTLTFITKNILSD